MYAPKGIRVNAILPGLIDGPIMDTEPKRARNPSPWAAWEACGTSRDGRRPSDPPVAVHGLHRALECRARRSSAVEPERYRRRDRLVDVTLVGLLGVGLLLTLLAIGVPIAFAMAFTGALGLWMLEGASSNERRNVGPDRHGRSALDFDQRTRLLCALDIQIDGDDARAFTSIGERAGLAIARLMSGRRSRSKN